MTALERGHRVHPIGNRSDPEWFQAPPLWRALDDHRAAPVMELALMWPLTCLALADAWLGAFVGMDVKQFNKSLAGAVARR